MSRLSQADLGRNERVRSKFQSFQVRLASITEKRPADTPTAVAL
jgi:hypothetical protein